MSFTPHIDSSHFSQFTFSTNITIPQVPINNIPILSFTPINMNSMIRHNLPMSPNIKPGQLIDMKQSINTVIPSTLSTSNQQIDKLKTSFSMSICTPTPYVKGCYGAVSKNSKVSESLQICSSLPVVNGCIRIPVTEQLKKDVNIVNEFPM